MGKKVELQTEVLIAIKKHLILCDVFHLWESPNVQLNGSESSLSALSDIHNARSITSDWERKKNNVFH